MIVLNKHIVPPETPHGRLSDYARGLFPEYPTRKGIKKAIKLGAVTINGEVGNTGSIVKPGDTIALVAIDRTPPAVSNRPLKIVYIDAHIAIVVKPAGLPVSGNFFPTLENVLVGHIHKSDEIDAWQWPHPAHRLDAPTSGLLIVARTRTAEMKLREAFRLRQIQKTYHALTMGSTPQSCIIRIPLDGKEAMTGFQTMDQVRSIKNDTLSLLVLQPQSGRKHQIRRHLSGIGHPILGDKLYGRPNQVFKGEGLFLAATGLEFSHPCTGESLTFSIPLPEKFLKRMQKEKKMWHRKTQNNLKTE